MVQLALAQDGTRQEGSVVVGRYGGAQFAPVQRMDIPKWRVSLDAAYSYRTAETASGLDALTREFVDKLRNGVMFGGGVHYFPVESFGFGLQAEMTHSSYSKKSATERINVLYVGPSGQWRGFDRRDRNAWIVGFSLGYYNYSEKFSYQSLSLIQSKDGLGALTEIGYDIRMGESNSFLGLRFSVFGGSFKVNDKSVSASGKNEYESLAAIRIGAGYRF
jgi:outer membrane protein W